MSTHITEIANDILPEAGGDVVLFPLDLDRGLGVLVNGLLSAEECRVLVAKFEEVGLSSLDREYPESYRNNKRLLFKCAALSDAIWQRLKRARVLDKFEGVRPFGFGNDGTWESIGLNEVWKACKYDVGGAFRPHYDGVFVRSDEERSAVTVMLYLNEDFEGGATNFLRESDNLKLESFSDPTCDVNKVIAKQIVPKTGSAVVFTHDILHEGAPLVSGVKYILRTEIMFQRTSDKSLSYKSQPDYVQALRLYDMSDLLEAEGDPYGSTICYLKALDLQAPYKSVTAPPTQQNPQNLPKPDNLITDFSALPEDMIAMVYAFLTASEILKLVLVCKKWKKVSSETWLWRRIFTQRWPLIPENRIGSLTNDAAKTKFSKKSKNNNSSNTNNNSNDSVNNSCGNNVDWRKAYQRCEKVKAPVVFIHSVTTTMAGYAGEKTPRFTSPSTFNGLIHPHFNIVGRGSRMVENQFSCDDFMGKFEGGYFYLPFYFKNTVKDEEMLVRMWALIYAKELKIFNDREAHGRPDYYTSRAHPILYVDFNSPVPSLTVFAESAFQIFRAPEFCICNFGQAVLFALNKTNGVVVDFGLDIDPEHAVGFETLKNNKSWFNMKGPPRISLQQDVLVQVVKDGKALANTMIERDKLTVESLVGALEELMKRHSGALDALENVVLIGSAVLPAYNVKSSLQQIHPKSKIEVFEPRNKETILWEGASLYAACTYNSKDYDTTDAELSDTGKWLKMKTFQDYESKKNKRGDFPSRIEVPKKKDKCVIG